MTSARQLAGTIREGLAFFGALGGRTEASLDALVELAEEQQRAVQAMDDHRIAREEALDEAVARAEKAERERDEWKDRYEIAAKVIDDTFPGLADEVRKRQEKMEAAEARVAELEEALRAIETNAKSWHGNGEEGKERALNVIGTWAADPSSIPAGVRAALAKEEQA